MQENRITSLKLTKIQEKERASVTSGVETMVSLNKKGKGGESK